MIVPRWEWRTFGAEFGEGETELAQLDCTRRAESAETYVIPPADGVNVKIRNHVLDIKLLRAVDENEFEQWEPVMKEAFPLGEKAIVDLFARMQVDAPPAGGGDFDEARFLGELVPSVPSLRMVAVSKERFGYQVEGAFLERANLVVGGTDIRTVAVEHEDPAVVLSLVRRFRFDRFDNINYIRALRKIAAGERL